MSDRERILALRQRILNEDVTFAQLLAQAYRARDIHAAFVGSKEADLDPMDVPSLVSFFNATNNRAAFFTSDTQRVQEIFQRIVSFLQQNPTALIAGLSAEQLRAETQEHGALHRLFHLGDEAGRRDFIQRLSVEQAKALRLAIHQEGTTPETGSLPQLLDEAIHHLPAKSPHPLIAARILAARAAILEQGISYAQMVEQGFTRAEMEGAIAGHPSLGVMPLQLGNLLRLYFDGDRANFFANSRQDYGNRSRHQLNLFGLKALSASVSQFISESNDATVMTALLKGGTLYPFLERWLASDRRILDDALTLESAIRVRNIIEQQGPYLMSLRLIQANKLMGELTQRIQQHVKEQIQEGRLTADQLLASGISRLDLEAVQAELVATYLKPKIVAGQLTTDMLIAGGFTQEHLDRARALYLKDATEEAIRLSISADAADRRKAIDYVNQVAVRAAHMGASPQELARFLGEGSTLKPAFSAVFGEHPTSIADRSLPADFMGSRIRNSIKADAYTAVLSRVLGDDALTPENFVEKMRAAGFDTEEIKRIAPASAEHNLLMSTTILGDVSQLNASLASLGYDVHGVWSRTPMIHRLASNLSAADALRLRQVASALPYIQQAAQRRAIEALSREAFTGHPADLDPEWKAFPGISDADKQQARWAYLMRHVTQALLRGSQTEPSREDIVTLQRAMAMGATPDELKAYVAALPPALRERMQQMIDLAPQARALTAFLGNEPVTAEGLSALLQSPAFKSLSSYQLAQLPVSVMAAGKLRDLLQAAADARTGIEDDHLVTLATATEQALLGEIRHQLASGEDGESKRTIEEMTPEHLEAAIRHASLDELQDIKRHMPPAPQGGEDPFARWRTMTTDLLHTRLATKIAEATAKGPEAVQRLLKDSGEFSHIRYGEIEAAMARLNGDQAQQLLTHLGALPAGAISQHAFVPEQYRKALSARIESVNQHVAQLRETLAAFENEENPELSAAAVHKLAVMVIGAQEAGVSDRAIGEVLGGIPSQQRITSIIEHGGMEHLALLRQVVKPDTGLFAEIEYVLRDKITVAAAQAPRDDVGDLWKYIRFANPADRAAARVAYLRAESERLQAMPVSLELAQRAAIMAVQKATIMGATADELKSFFDALPPALRTTAQHAAADWPRIEVLQGLLRSPSVTPDMFMNILTSWDQFKDMTAEDLRRLPKSLMSADMLKRLAELSGENSPHHTDPRIQALFSGASHFQTEEIRAAFTSGNAEWIAQAQKMIPEGEGQLELVVQGMPLEDVAAMVANLPAAPQAGDDPFESLRAVSTAHLHSQIATRIAELSAKGLSLPAAEQQRNLALFASLKPEDIKAGLGQLSVEQAQRLRMQLAVIPASMRERMPLAAKDYLEMLNARVATAQAQLTQIKERLTALDDIYATIRRGEAQGPIGEEVMMRADALLQAVKSAREKGVGEPQIRQMLANLSPDQWSELGGISHGNYPELASLFPDSYRAGLVTTLKEQVAQLVSAKFDLDSGRFQDVLSAMDRARWAGVPNGQIGAELAGLPDEVKQHLGNIAYVDFPTLAEHLPPPTERMKTLVAQERQRIQLVQQAKTFAAVAGTDESAVTQHASQVLAAMQAATELKVPHTDIQKAIASLSPERLQMLGGMAHTQFPALAGVFPPAYQTALAAMLKAKVAAYAASNREASGETLAALVTTLDEARWAGIKPAQIVAELSGLSAEHRTALDQLAAASAPQLATVLADHSNQGLDPAKARRLAENITSSHPWKTEQTALFRRATESYIKKALAVAASARAARDNPATINPATGKPWVAQDIERALSDGQDAATTQEILTQNLHLTTALSVEQQQALLNVVLATHDESNITPVRGDAMRNWSREVIAARLLEQGLRIPAEVVGFGEHKPTAEHFQTDSPEQFWTAQHRELFAQAWQEELQHRKDQRREALISIAEDTSTTVGLRVVDRPSVRSSVEMGKMADAAEMALKKIQEAIAAGTVPTLTENERKGVRYVIDSARHTVARLSKGGVPSGMPIHEYALYGMGIKPEWVGIEIPASADSVSEADRGAAPDGPTLDRSRQRMKAPETATIDDGAIRSEIRREPIVSPRADIDHRLLADPALRMAETYRRILADPRIAGIGWTSDADRPITLRSGPEVTQRAQAFLAAVGTPPEKAAEAVRDKPQEMRTDVADASSARIKAGQVDARKDKQPDEQEQQRGVA